MIKRVRGEVWKTLENPTFKSKVRKEKIGKSTKDLVFIEKVASYEENV